MSKGEFVETWDSLVRDNYSNAAVGLLVDLFEFAAGIMPLTKQGRCRSTVVFRFSVDTP